MNTKHLLLVGTAAWIGYMLYSNMKRDQRIRELRKQVADSEAKLKQVLDGFAGKLLAVPTQSNAGNGFSKDAVIFPDGINKHYDTCKGVTVAPPPVKVTVYPTT